MHEGQAIAAGATPPDGSWSEVGRWTITGPNSLTAIRRSIADAVLAHSTGAAGNRQNERPPPADAAERLLLVSGELAANGLRHARPPVTLALSCTEGLWLVVVSDHLKRNGPVLREPDPDGAGGIGLHLVLAVSENVGWHVSGPAKHVWAVVAPDGV